MNKEKMDSIKGHAKAIFNDVARMPFTFFKVVYDSAIKRGETEETVRKERYLTVGLVALASVSAGLMTGGIGFALLTPYLVTSAAAYRATDKVSRDDDNTKILWPNVTDFRETESGDNGSTPPVP